MNNEFVIVKNAFDIDTRAYFSGDEEFANMLAEILTVETGFDWKVYRETPVDCEPVESVQPYAYVDFGIHNGFMSEENENPEDPEEEESGVEEAFSELVEFFAENSQDEVEDLIEDAKDIAGEYYSPQLAFWAITFVYHIAQTFDDGQEPDFEFLEFCRDNACSV